MKNFMYLIGFIFVVISLGILGSHLDQQDKKKCLSNGGMWNNRIGCSTSYYGK